MPVSSDYLQYVLEQLARLPRVSSRRMFGAIGLYSDTVFFGIIDNDTLFFKVDDSTRERYVTRGSQPFRPYKDRPEVSMSYFHVPADVLEDADECRRMFWKMRTSFCPGLASPSAPRRRPLKPSVHPNVPRRNAPSGRLRVAHNVIPQDSLLLGLRSRNGQNFTRAPTL
jgi:DNA transformation protein and related proteins